MALHLSGSISLTGSLTAGTSQNNTGTLSTITGGSLNSGSGDYSVIGGGYSNNNHGYQSFVGAGNGNYIYPGTSASSIVGGNGNSIRKCDVAVSSVHNTIGGGTQNYIDGGYANVIAGGNANYISGSCSYSAVLGGSGIRIEASNCSTVVAGRQNCIINSSIGYNLIVGGYLNQINSSNCSGILGGKSNYISHDNSMIIGSNLTSDKACYTFMNNLDVEGTVSASIFSGSFVGDGSGLTGISGGGNGEYVPFITGSVSSGILPREGSNCCVLGNFATIAGGNLNTASAACSFIGGGANNYLTSGNGVLVGGSNNYVCSTGNVTLVGGCNNIASGCCTFLGGGVGNFAEGSTATLVGGWNNCLDANNGFIGGGCFNTASGNFGVIVGGYQNYITSNGQYGSILGGRHNLLGSNTADSFIVGSHITGSHECTSYVNNLTITGSAANNGIMTLKRFESTPTNLEGGSIFHSGSAGAGCLYFSPNGSSICQIAFV